MTGNLDESRLAKAESEPDPQRISQDVQRSGRRPLRFRGLTPASGLPDWRQRARIYRVIAIFIAVGTVLDFAGRISGETTPRWSTLAIAVALSVVFGLLARRARHKDERLSSRNHSRP